MQFYFFLVLHNCIYAFTQTPPKVNMRAMLFHVFIINQYHSFSFSSKESSLTVLWHFILVVFLECGLWLLSYCLHELSASNQGLVLFSSSNVTLLKSLIVSFSFIIWYMGNFTTWFLHIDWFNFPRHLQLLAWDLD